MSVLTDAALTTEANIIKNETANLANTATRVGQMFIDLIDSKLLPKTYAAILSQAGTAAPTVDTLVYNTLSGPIVWTRNSIGNYSGTLTGAFTTGKTIVTPMSFYSKISAREFYFFVSNANTVTILARDDAGAFADLNISQFSDITIRVYP